MRAVALASKWLWSLEIPRSVRPNPPAKPPGAPTNASAPSRSIADASRPEQFTPQRTWLDESPK